MNIRLYHARILTMEPDRPVFEGEIRIRDGKIVYVGEEQKPDTHHKELAYSNVCWDQEIDCKGNLLLPGFKDAHTHSGMTFLRSYADDMPLSRWLNEKIFPMEKRLSGEDISCFVKLAILEYLTSGITSIFDMYLMPDITALSCMEMGMRCVLVSGLNNFTSSVEAMEEEYLRWRDASSLITYQLGFHAEYTCSKKLLQELSSLSHKLCAPVFTHMCETEQEVAECIKNYGMTPPAFLNSLGLFDYGGGGYHCVYMTDEDISIFKKRHLYVITNPASNLKLASGIAPIADYIKYDIPVAIGTDGAASNNCLDMFREMFLVTGLAKLREKDAACVDAMEVLKMATVNGAKAMRLNQCDILAEGKNADIVMIDLHQPNMQPIHSVGKNLIYSGSKQNVKMTMIDGKILYMDGRFYTDILPEDIYHEAERRIHRLKERNV